jgi:hypothetical protein
VEHCNEVIEKWKLRFKAYWLPSGISESIFDTEEEAKEYATQIGQSLVIDITEVHGVIGRQFVRTGMMTGYDQKVWVELSTEGLEYYRKLAEKRRKREERKKAKEAIEAVA